MKHEFQEWMEENGVKDVSFFPNYRKGLTSYNILDDAMKAVNALEEGRCEPYVDNVKEEFYLEID